VLGRPSTRWILAGVVDWSDTTLSSDMTTLCTGTGHVVHKVRSHGKRCAALYCGMRQKRRNMPHDAATQRIRCERTYTHRWWEVVTSTPVSVRSTAISVYVCMSVFSVYLFVCPKTTRPNFTTFSVHVTCDCGSVLLWGQCDTLCTSGFVDDVMFSYNGLNRSESKTTRMLHWVR